jgi:hypothetical protein
MPHARDQGPGPGRAEPGRRHAGSATGASGDPAAPQARQAVPARMSPGSGHALRRGGSRRSTIASAIRVPGWRRRDGRFPGSAPQRAGPVSRRGRPPSRSSGRPGAPAAGRRGPGIPRQPSESGVTGASPSRCPQPGAGPSGRLAVAAAVFWPGIMAKPSCRAGNARRDPAGEPQPARGPAATATSIPSRAYQQGRSPVAAAFLSSG